MAIPQTEDGSISLIIESPEDLNKVKIGLGRGTPVTDGTDCSLDVSAFLLSVSGKIRSNNDCVFYGNNSLKQTEGTIRTLDDSIVHTSSNPGEEDDVEIHVTLNSVAEDIQRIVFAVTIRGAENAGCNFGQFRSAYIRIVNVDNNKELARFDISEDFGASTVISGMFELYRQDGKWQWQPPGKGANKKLDDLLKDYGWEKSIDRCSLCGLHIEKNRLCEFCGNISAIEPLTKNDRNQYNLAQGKVASAKQFNDFVIEGDVLKKYIGQSEIVIIPEMIRVIGEHCFKDLPIKKVKIPASVEYIGNEPEGKVNNNNGAFERCEQLESIFFDENSKLQSIERYAFYGCKDLKRIVGLPIGIKTIKSRSFAKCDLDETSKKSIETNTAKLSDDWDQI